MDQGVRADTLNRKQSRIRPRGQPRNPDWKETRMLSIALDLSTEIIAWIVMIGNQIALGSSN